jgi:hypothetical protein
LVALLEHVVGRRLQEGFTPCNSGMAQEEYFQDDSDPGKLWAAASIGRRQNKVYPPVKRGTAQGKRRKEESGRRQRCTENPEGMYVQDETLEGPIIRNRNRGPRQKPAAAS